MTSSAIWVHFQKVHARGFADVLVIGEKQQMIATVQRRLANNADAIAA
jgi:hypothetical protein